MPSTCTKDTSSFCQLSHFAPSLFDRTLRKTGAASPSCKVLGISLNCVGMSDNDALREIQKGRKRETKLPATDPIKFGVDKFIDVIRPLLP